MNSAWEKHYYEEYLPAVARTAIYTHENQIIASWIILGLVSLLCISGVALAAAQLYWSRDILKDLANNTEIGSAGIKLASPFVGLLILAVSFSFFYMYVKEVYAIKYIEPPAAVRAATSSAPGANSAGTATGF
jgi:ABC-type multidrug transport system fused ATPase/permease subunit